MYGLWFEYVAGSNYRNHDYKEALESFDAMFEILKHNRLDISSMQKVIKAVSHIEDILDKIGVNLFSYELERMALETKCKGLILLEEYEEIAEIHIRLRDLTCTS